MSNVLKHMQKKSDLFALFLFDIVISMFWDMQIFANLIQNHQKVISDNQLVWGFNPKAYGIQVLCSVMGWGRNLPQTEWLRRSEPRNTNIFSKKNFLCIFFFENIFVELFETYWIKKSEQKKLLRFLRIFFHKFQHILKKNSLKTIKKSFLEFFLGISFSYNLLKLI